jgi:hypothetical protein
LRRAIPENGSARIKAMGKVEQLVHALRHDDNMDDQAFEWVTLFSYENVPGCPRPGRLTAD